MRPLEPSIGRIVHFRGEDGYAPAIVANVYVEGLDEGRPYVDMVVFIPGEPPLWCMARQEGSAIGTWRWPPRH